MQPTRKLPNPCLCAWILLHTVLPQTLPPELVWVHESIVDVYMHLLSLHRSAPYSGPPKDGTNTPTNQHTYVVKTQTDSVCFDVLRANSKDNSWQGVAVETTKIGFAGSGSVSSVTPHPTRGEI